MIPAKPEGKTHFIWEARRVEKNKDGDYMRLTWKHTTESQIEPFKGVRRGIQLLHLYGTRSVHAIIDEDAIVSAELGKTRKKRVSRGRMRSEEDFINGKRVGEEDQI